jgi:hypothetical protein
MPLVLKDRVKETTTTAGTGTVTLDGAVTGFQTFAIIGDGNTTYYCIAGQGSNEWEVGIGTYTSSGTTLSRDTVLASSAGGTTKVTFSAGTKDVFCTYPAEKSVNFDAAGAVVIDNISIDGNTIASINTNGNIVLAPNGSGDVQVDADTLRVGDSNANATITTNGTGDLILNTNAGTDSGSITINDAANGNIIVTPNGTGAVGIGLTPVASNGILQLNSYAAIKEMIETSTVTGSAPSATTDFDVITQAVQYYTSNATTNFTLNIRGNSGTSLNTIMQNGQSVTITLLVTNGATAYYANVYQVDGAAVTPKWLGGAAPAAGNASGIDVYTFVVIKTASATFTVLASQSRFA